MKFEIVKNMKIRITLTLLLPLLLITACKKSSPADEGAPAGKIELAQNYVPYKTEKYLRICYMLSTWEFMKEGLKLQTIIVYNNDTKIPLDTIPEADLPFIWKSPLPQSSEITIDNITRYYLSLQVPLPLDLPAPATLGHRFILSDTVKGQTVTVEGGIVPVRKQEAPRLIAAPVKGNYYLFHNQSTLGYHYYLAFFVNGGIWTNEKFAFDLTRIDSTWEETYSGDPAKNESYFAYGDTLYAVASGKVLKVTDNRAENSGNLRNAVLTKSDEYYGNYLVLDIGGGVYAMYMHCLPFSFMVRAGDVIAEGQPVALLGNSGNSTEPHLHFQLTDLPDPGFSHGLPMVFKSFKKTGEIRLAPVVGPVQINPHIQATSANMENWSIVDIP